MSLLAEKGAPTRVPANPRAHSDGAAAFVPDQSRARAHEVVRRRRLPGARRARGGLALHAGRPARAAVRRRADRRPRRRDSRGCPTTSPSPRSPPRTPAALGIPPPGDRAAVLAVAHADAACTCAIPAEAELAEPVRLRLDAATGAASRATSWSRAGGSPRPSSSLEHDGSADYTEVLSVVAGDGADLTVVTVQEWDDDATTSPSTTPWSAATPGSSTSPSPSAAGSCGSAPTRAMPVPAARFEALGVYFADAGQHLEHRLFVDHEPRTARSQRRVQGRPAGRLGPHRLGRRRAHPRRGRGHRAPTSSTATSSSPTAPAPTRCPTSRSRPARSSGAGHASATGRFDDEQLFYLKARGIPEDVARRLVVRGFFAAVVGRIGVDEVRSGSWRPSTRELAQEGADERRQP